MSLVYAKKVADSVVVFSDTKITFSDTVANSLWSDETHTNVQNYGLIKNMILDNNYCVSFAGNNIAYANEFLVRLSSLEEFELEQLVSIALEIHLKDCDNCLDFIVCYADDETKEIIEIKNGISRNVDVAWIGSINAFRFFQGINLGEIDRGMSSNNPLGVHVSYGSSDGSVFESEYEKLFRSFYKTLYDCKDSTVGGFVVPIIYSKNKKGFCYKGYIESYAISEKIPGGLRLPMYQNSSAGSFSIIFYHSNSIVGIYIPQGNLGIIYSQYRLNQEDYENKRTSMFLLPQVTKMSQLDYYIQTEVHGLSAPGFLGCNPEDIDEIFKRINHYKDNPQICLIYINKIIEIIRTQHREENRLYEIETIKKDILSKIPK